jgi:hypothetical protein
MRMKVHQRHSEPYERRELMVSNVGIFAAPFA